MQDYRSKACLFAALLAIAVLMSASLYTLTSLNGSIQTLLESHRIVQRMSPTYTTSWVTTVDGASCRHVVNTYIEEGESASDCAARHKDAVDALQAIYPPD